MKVTKELKELLKHKLDKVYQKKRQEKIDAITVEHQEIIDELIILNKEHRDIKRKLKITQQQFESPGCYLNDDGTVNIRDDKIDFDVQDQLFNFIEILELSDDNEGDLKDILESISKL